MKGDLGTVSLDAEAVCSQVGDRPVWLTFAASHSVMETQVRLGLEKMALCHSLDVCISRAQAANTNRRHQIPFHLSQKSGLIEDDL